MPSVDEVNIDAILKNKGTYDSFKAAIRNNPEKLNEFAIKYYHRLASRDQEDKTRSWDDFFIVTSRLILRAFKSLDSAEKEALKKVLTRESNTYFEPGFWEHPLVVYTAHEGLDKLREEKMDTTLLSLLLLAHDIEYFVRPNLCRLNWVIRRACNQKCSYEEKQLHDGVECDIWVPINEISDFLGEGCNRSRKKMNRIERETVLTFIRSLDENGDWKLCAANIRNWTFHRDFFIADNQVKINFKPNPGQQITLKYDTVYEILKQQRGLDTIMVTLSTVFKLCAESELGELEMVPFRDYPLL